MALLVPKSTSPVHAVQLKQDLLGMAGDWVVLHGDELRHFTAAEFEALAWLFERIAGDEPASPAPIVAQQAPEPPPAPIIITPDDRALAEMVARLNAARRNAVQPKKKINGADKNYAARQPRGRNFESMMKVQIGRFFYLLRSLGRPATAAEVKAITDERDRQANISAGLHSLREAGFVTSESNPGESSYLWNPTEEGCRVWDAAGPMCFTNYDMQIPPDRFKPADDSREALVRAWEGRHNP